MEKYSYSVRFNVHSSTGAGGFETIEEALAKAWEQASYYVCIGRENVTIEIEKQCPKCNGVGFKGRNQTRCKHCDWGFNHVLGPFPCKLHENVAHIASEDVLYSKATVTCS